MPKIALPVVDVASLDVTIPCLEPIKGLSPDSTIDYTCGNCAADLMLSASLKPLLGRYCDIDGRVLLLCKCGARNSCGAPALSNDPVIKQTRLMMKNSPGG